MAVIAAFELDHLVAPSEGAHEAKHSHASFGAAVHKADHLDAGNSIDHHFSEGVLEGAGGTKAGALFDRFLESANHFGVGMAANGGPPAPDVVDVFIAIDIPGIGTLDPIEHDRLTTHRLKRAHWRAHSTGHQALRCAEDGLGAAGVQRRCCHRNRRQEANANRASS